jgi:hypothetical protein
MYLSEMAQSHWEMARSSNLQFILSMSHYRAGTPLWK